jgi:predicted Zn-dependent protease
LQVAEAAQRLSKHPESYDTLGTILMKLGRPSEALVQLETALRSLPGRPALHRKLADVYQQLGNAKLAAEHRQLAEQLDQSREPGTR